MLSLGSVNTENRAPPAPAPSMFLNFSEELGAALFSGCKNNGKNNAFPLVLFKIKKYVTLHKRVRGELSLYNFYLM